MGGGASRDMQIVWPLTPSQRQRLRDRYAAVQAQADDDVIMLLDYLGWVERELLRMSQRSEEMKSRLTRTSYGVRSIATPPAFCEQVDHLPHSNSMS